MNRFKQLIDETRERAKAAGLLIEESPMQPRRPVKSNERDSDEPANVQQLRLPYSSDPEPIGEPWDLN